MRDYFSLHAETCVVGTTCVCMCEVIVELYHIKGVFAVLPRTVVMYRENLCDVLKISSPLMVYIIDL